MVNGCIYGVKNLDDSKNVLSGMMVIYLNYMIQLQERDKVVYTLILLAEIILNNQTDTQIVIIIILLLYQKQKHNDPINKIKN